MSRLIIAGSSGFVGQHIINHPTICSMEKPIIELSRSIDSSKFFDLEYPQKIDFDVFKNGDIVLMLAAISSPDFCRDKYKEAYQVNVNGTKFFIDNLLLRGVKVLFASSDTVYGETVHPVDEYSPVNPINEYAQMKCDIEQSFLNDSLFKVMRLSYIFANNDKFTKYLLESSNSNDIAEIYHPIIRSVIYINDVIESVTAIIHRWEECPSIINMAGPEFISRLDIARSFASIRNLQYREVHPEEVFFKARPKKIFMHSKFLPKILGRSQTQIYSALQKEFKIQE